MKQTDNVMAIQQNADGEVRISPVCPTIACRGGIPGQGYQAVVYCLQGNGIDRADTAGCNGRGWSEDVGYTLNTIDKHAVVYAVDGQGGKGNANFAEDIMPTIMSDSHGTPHAVAYAIDSQSSNSWKSSNPHSGIHETDKARCLDTSIDPTCNQGGYLL